MQRLFPENNFVAPLICEGTRLVVAEAPGEQEQLQGSPLVGPTGNWLFGRIDEATGKTYGGLYKRAGVDGSTVSRINCLNCRPPENVFPTDPDARSYISKEDAELAVDHCYRSHVLPLLSGRTWSRVDLLGDKALRIVAGVDGGIMRWRGSPLPIPDLGPSPITVPTIHPAALARDQTLIPAVVSDLKKCIPGEVRVLCQDLVWRRADRLEVGTEIIATDEEGGGSRGRRLRAATVDAIEVLEEPCVEVVTDQGTLITSTKHGWLVDVRHRGFVWRDAETLKEGDVVEFYKKPWETLYDEPEAHYLAGFLDGEGYISEAHCGFNQNGGELLDRVVACCQRLGFHVTARPLKGRKLVQVYFDGESAAGMRAVGSLRPFRLLKKSRVLWEGRCISGKLNPNAKVIRVTPVGNRKVYAIQTSTKTLITEGFVTHNSLVVPEEHYVTQPGIEEVRAFQATKFAFDIETDMSTGHITMVGLCDRSNHAICVPFGGAYVVELKRIFRAATELVCQNGLQFDLPVLQEHGIVVPASIPIWDTMLMHHLLQPDLPHGLAFLGSVFTNKPAWKHLSGDDEALYNCRDVDVTWQCFKQLRPALVAAGVDQIYSDLSVPLARICALMHRTGFKVDPSRIGAVREELTKETASAEARLPDHLRTHTVPVRKRVPAPPGTLGKSGKPVKFVFEAASETVTPWRSTIDVQKFLYDPVDQGGLALPVQLHVKSQRPTSDKVALDRLARNERRASLRTQAETAERHATNAVYLEAIQKLRKLDELLTTFCKEEMLSVDRMYPHFSVHGTASGRLCLAPQTKVLYSDLTWRRCDTVKPGDELIGFDEEKPTKGTRKLRRSVVGEVGRYRLPSYCIVFSDLSWVIASEDHGWLTERGKSSRCDWRKTKDLAVGDRLRHWRQPWETDGTYDGGFLSGFLSGEGHVSKQAGAVCFTQNSGASFEEIKEVLERLGLEFSTSPAPNSNLNYVYLHDGPNVLGRFKPRRLMEQSSRCWEGKGAGSRYTNTKEVLALIWFGERDVIGFETSTKTFLAEGLLSHNSSSDPNLQNIPQTARFIYVPSHSDWRLLEVDYSSIENRLTAYFANDTERLKRWAIDPSFNEHRWTASMFFGIPYEEVDKDSEEYKKAKRINHGSNYGMGPVKIAKLYDMDLAEVRRLCGLWREINALTCKWQEETGRRAKDQGFLVNPFGRKRWFYTDSYFTESLSFLPQSTGADIILRAMVALYYDRVGWPEEAARRLVPITICVPLPVRLLLQVHDSLVFELPGSLADECVGIVQRVMEQPWRELGGLSIPIDVKLSDPGCSWGEVKKWQPQQSFASL